MTAENLAPACDALARRDRELGAVLSRWGYPPLWNRRGGFAALVLMILEQQVSLDSARAVFRRLEAAAGGRVAPQNVLALGVDGLRGAGLTRQKAGYCHALAERVAGGELSFTKIARVGEDRARELLRGIRGVGEWTADVYLLFVLRRPDVWPPRDIALMRSIAEVYGLDPMPDDAACLARAERWRPWRSVAARILWHAYLSRRNRAAAF